MHIDTAPNEEHAVCTGCVTGSAFHVIETEVPDGIDVSATECHDWDLLTDGGWSY